MCTVASIHVRDALDYILVLNVKEKYICSSTIYVMVMH